ncbi:RNA polymerase sigma-54 factor RpoN [Lachnospiraceae bacterium TWA4]|nr:RNA polymerase sigma-54 factor RpoN [Lachnospiraceae bacterium TWA4]
MEDKEIIDLYFMRNEQAIRETDIKYGKVCLNLAYNLLNNIEDSEECVNDTYLGTWNKVPPTRPQNFRAFILKIARNLSLKKLDYCMAAKRTSHKIVPFHEVDELLGNDHFSKKIDDEQLGELITRFLRNEDQTMRNVFIRKYWFFDSVEAIAKRYSFSESKVKSILYRSRKRLKIFLKKEGIWI